MPAFRTWSIPVERGVAVGSDCAVFGKTASSVCNCGHRTLGSVLLTHPRGYSLLLLSEVCGGIGVASCRSKSTEYAGRVGCLNVWTLLCPGS